MAPWRWWRASSGDRADRDQHVARYQRCRSRSGRRSRRRPPVGDVYTRPVQQGRDGSCARCSHDRNVAERKARQQRTWVIYAAGVGTIGGGHQACRQGGGDRTGDVVRQAVLDRRRRRYRLQARVGKPGAGHPDQRPPAMRRARSRCRWQESRGESRVGLAAGGEYNGRHVPADDASRSE